MFWNHHCHHHSDHGYEHSDQSVDYHNINDDQYKYDLSYVKFILSCQFNFMN